MVKQEPGTQALPGDVVLTAAGVFKPAPLKTEVAVFVVAALVFAAVIAFHPAAGAGPWLGLVALAGLGLVRAVVYRRHGPLGRPTLALQGDRLVFSLPQDSRGQATVNWAEFQRLTVYGASGRRIFRFERQGAEPVEVRPLWGRALESGAVEFLRRSLPPALCLTVEEPQTAFATVRGDGPAR